MLSRRWQPSPTSSCGDSLIQGARIQFQGPANRTPVLFEGFGRRGLGQTPPGQPFKCTRTICFATDPITHATFQVFQVVLNTYNKFMKIGDPLQTDGLIGPKTVARAEAVFGGMGELGFAPPTFSATKETLASRVAERLFLNELAAPIGFSAAALNDMINARANVKTETVLVAGEPTVQLPKDALAELAKNISTGEVAPEIEAAAKTASDEKRTRTTLFVGLGIGAVVLGTAMYLVWGRS